MTREELDERRVELDARWSSFERLSVFMGCSFLGVMALAVILSAAGTCSSAFAMGKEMPQQTAIPAPTVVDWLALIGPIGVGVAAVVGVVWEIYRRRRS